MMLYNCKCIIVVLPWVIFVLFAAVTVPFMQLRLEYDSGSPMSVSSLFSD